jgi:hypothetical protein
MEPRYTGSDFLFLFVFFHPEPCVNFIWNPTRVRLQCMALCGLIQYIPHHSNARFWFIYSILGSRLRLSAQFEIFVNLSHGREGNHVSGLFQMLHRISDEPMGNCGSSSTTSSVLTTLDIAI